MAWGICNVSFFLPGLMTRWLRMPLLSTHEILTNRRRSIARFPLPLHLTLVEGTTSLPSGQQRLGVPEVWSLRNRLAWKKRGNI